MTASKPELDVNKLLGMGKLKVEIKIGDTVFYMETATSHDLTSSLNADKTTVDMLGLLARSISKIGDREYGTPESKIELRKILESMQGAVIARLSKACDDLTMQQNKLIEEMTEQNF